MLSEAGLRSIADLFIGDVPGYYAYKSGGKLVEFFNSNFGFRDVYKQGFPSRWHYTVENMKILINTNKFDEFLNLILSKRFIMRDSSFNDIQAVEQIEKTISYLNEELHLEGFKIYKRGNEYTLISEDGDLEFVGEGGFALVYKSKSTGLIVKKLKEDFLSNKGVRSRFKREYELTKSLEDLKGVIDVYDFDASEYSYTMEAAEKTLYDFIIDFDHTEQGKIVMIRQILYIMKSVHERSIIHRDISPNNILIFNGQLKISDFGLGKDLEIFHSYRTMVTNSFGQYYYCAPEQFMQLKDGDKKSDVYSLGSLINFIMTRDPRDSKHFLRNPVEKSRNENPNMRFADAGALLVGIEHTIAYHENQERREAVNMKIKDRIYDEDVENYLYSLNGVELCRDIVSNSNMISTVLEFISNDEKRAMEVMQSIDQNYSDVCHTWTDYDNFGSIAYNVIKDNLPYVVQEISARILYDIAFVKNRFDMQRLVDNLIERGIDPTIEDLLK